MRKRERAPADRVSSTCAREARGTVTLTVQVIAADRCPGEHGSCRREIGWRVIAQVPGRGRGGIDRTAPIGHLPRAQSPSESLAGERGLSLSPKAAGALPSRAGLGTEHAVIAGEAD